MTMWKNYLLCVLLGAVLMSLSVFCISHNRPVKPTEQKIVRDTIIFRDTIRIEKPIEKELRVTDTLYVSVTDTIVKNDTTYVYLVKTEKVYADSTYRLQVSGYKPTLDWIEVYPVHITVFEKETKVITENNKWGLGLTLGYGISTYSKQVILSPYIGLGISYNFIRW